MKNALFILGTICFSIYYFYEISSYISNTSIYYQYGDSFDCCPHTLAHVSTPRSDRFIFDFVFLCSPPLTICCETS